MGHSIKRRKTRFIRGKGTYVDDVVLPACSNLDIVRSPFAHAKIKKIDASKATAIPGVLAVITGQDLAKYNLHWMPTLMSDTQMVLPVEKVMYQLRKAAVARPPPATRRPTAWPRWRSSTSPAVVVDPRKALEAGRAGAPHRQEDKKRTNHIWHWEWGNRAETDRAFTEADVTIKRTLHPADPRGLDRNLAGVSPLRQGQRPPERSG